MIIYRLNQPSKFTCAIDFFLFFSHKRLTMESMLHVHNNQTEVTMILQDVQNVVKRNMHLLLHITYVHIIYCIL